jgi:hypothetical protein
MKPRFSVRSMLFGIGYLALNLMAILQPESYWPVSVMVVWLFIVAALLATALNPRLLDFAMAARVACCCIAIYASMSLMNGMLPMSNRWSLFPHQHLSRWWYETELNGLRRRLPPTPLGNSYRMPSKAIPVNRSPAYAQANENLRMHRDRIVEPIAILNFSLLFGVLGGYLGLRRCRCPNMYTSRPATDSCATRYEGNGG